MVNVMHTALIVFEGTSAPTSPQPPPTTAPAVSDEVMDRLRPAMTPGLSSSAPERSSMEEWFEVMMSAILSLTRIIVVIIITSTLKAVQFHKAR